MTVTPVASLMDQNPLIWMFELDGFSVDLRMARREIQEFASEHGLIPSIPADRDAR